MRYDIDFAISFSRDQRRLAKRLAERLKAGGAVVFYDGNHQAYLLGKRLDRVFSHFFGSGTRYFVPIVSDSYVERIWPQYEWNVAKREKGRRAEEFILPLRLDDTFLVGLPDTVAYLDLRDICLNDAADILLQKLGGNGVTVGSTCWIATFGLRLEDIDQWERSSQAPPVVPELYDWLIEDLLELLMRGGPLVDKKVVEDARTGETLSVRIAFQWNHLDGALQFGDLEWWELLELRPFEEVLG